MIEKVERVEFNRGLRVEKVERSIDLNLSTHPQPSRATPESGPTSHVTATERVDINERLPPSPADDPSCLAFGRALRARFGMGVKIYPDRYAGVWP